MMDSHQGDESLPRPTGGALCSARQWRSSCRQSRCCGAGGSSSSATSSTRTGFRHKHRQHSNPQQRFCVSGAMVPVRQPQVAWRQSLQAETSTKRQCNCFSRAKSAGQQDDSRVLCPPVSGLCCSSTETKASMAPTSFRKTASSAAPASTNSRLHVATAACSTCHDRPFPGIEHS
jgi:hypothetical protein